MAMIEELMKPQIRRGMDASHADVLAACSLTALLVQKLLRLATLQVGANILEISTHIL